jgi:hypothetical protein
MTAGLLSQLSYTPGKLEHQSWNILEQLEGIVLVES